MRSPSVMPAAPASDRTLRAPMTFEERRARFRAAAAETFEVHGPMLDALSRL